MRLASPVWVLNCAGVADSGTELTGLAADRAGLFVLQWGNGSEVGVAVLGAVSGDGGDGAVAGDARGAEAFVVVSGAASAVGRLDPSRLLCAPAVPLGLLNGAARVLGVADQGLLAGQHVGLLAGGGIRGLRCDGLGSVSGSESGAVVGQLGPFAESVGVDFDGVSELL